ncbi:unnamed protein product [Bursaphelenchus okinawaensis]|uniref:Uncharacterized protein n=1 Tax=Bursaphelenchus okinawaensis TaxID=465554 RepID=A0A811K644_9BILA|nr:unnamed protein product [Bursaphelenchus okinawaensis]CAG9093002.1 unnamed protein product [Bursaphelenchus okinawaensis]
MRGMLVITRDNSPNLEQGTGDKSSNGNRHNSVTRVTIAPPHLTVSGFRPFERANQPHLWDLGSDRYLHFPATHSKRNEYLHWACNVTSDTEDEAEEWLEDWLQARAANAGLDIRFGHQPSSSAQAKHVAQDLFDLVHRTFEMSSFDQLLKDQAVIVKRSLQMNSLNKPTQQANNFMKIFKGDKKVTDSLAEDDEDDDEEEQTEDDIKDDQDLNHAPAFQEKPVIHDFKQTLNLTLGLKSCLLLYGFNWDKNISDADMKKYKKYVQLGQKNVNDVRESEVAGSLSSFSRLPPIFQFQRYFYTVDSVFSTELDDIPEKSMKVYRDVVQKQNFEPLPQAVMMYERYKIQ